MRGRPRGAILGLVLLVAASGITLRAVISQTGGRAQPSTIPAQPSTIPAQPSTIPAQPSTIPAQPSTVPGIALAFIAARNCIGIVPVTDGFVGSCSLGYGAGDDPYSGPALIGNDGVLTLLPDRYNFSRVFSDGADNLVAQQSGSASTPLRVIDPTSGAVKKAIPLPYLDTSLIGLTGTTAILAGYEAGGDGTRTGRVMAYDISGAKRWDVSLPRVGMHVEITPAGVLVFEDIEEIGRIATRPPSPLARMLRLDDGSTLWDGSGEGLSIAPERVGRTVLYDNAGVPRSLATGAPTGRGPGASAGAVAYEDDLILTNPLRRMTPKGETVWTLQDTSGTPATDGETLVVLVANDLVVLDPATGQRLGQAPDPSPNLKNCGTIKITVATPRVVIAHPCLHGAGTPVYTVSR